MSIAKQILAGLLIVTFVALVFIWLLEVSSLVQRDLTRTLSLTHLQKWQRNLSPARPHREGSSSAQQLRRPFKF